MTTDEAWVETVAKVCHEANRAYCEGHGDWSVPSWAMAPAAMLQSAINGVRFHLINPDADASASHENWRKEKVAAGWVFGEEKNYHSRPPTHPCLVSFDKLSEVQQRKDHLFKAVVKALTSPF